ncbi:MAG: DNA topoisomerase III [Clostridia bacterium]|nr:DNA topoisomerase III [Clostridia bacterium]
MGKILIIAEKPSVGRDIARVLKCSQKGDGFLYNDSHIVSWAIGHLVTLQEPAEYDMCYKKWSMETLPIVPDKMQLKVLPRTKKQFNILKKLMKDKDVSSLICATDSGREGELIFRYIYQMVTCKKPFQRLWISSMTDEAIQDGFARLKPGSDYDPLYESARCRSEADWLVGINGSRAFTIQYNNLLSIGRVQTPTLAILVARQKEIDAFIPQDYWEVLCDFESYEGIWYKEKVSQTKLFKKEEAVAIANKVKKKTGQVLSVSKELKRQLFPQLYDLTELQRDANRRYGFSAQKTLKTAQQLYESRKLITYPRTDSRYLTSDLVSTLPGLLQNLDQVPYSEFVKPLLSPAKLPTGKRLVDDSKVSDHHAIIPTKTKKRVDLPADEEKIYDLIVRRFLAVFYPPYEYEETQIHTEVEKETFYTKGIVEKSLGWKAVYQNRQEESQGVKGQDRKRKDENQPLPELEEGQTVTAENAKLVSKKTQPPKPYTEATLLSAMENAGRFVEDEELKEQLKNGGLGTPATRAAIIERLLQVAYISRKGKTLIPTEKGRSLIEVVPEELKSPETTGKWEKALGSIARGTMKPERFMGSIVRYVDYIVTEAKARRVNVVFPKEPYPRKKTNSGKPTARRSGNSSSSKSKAGNHEGQ